MVNISFEQFLLDLLSNLGETNFDVAIKVILIFFAVFWLFVVGWVWNDSGERSTKFIYRILSSLLVLIFNIPGLIIYLLMRPDATIEELYWADLERRYLKYETADLGDCPRCKKQLQAGFVACPYCGEPIKEKCRVCGNYLERTWTICPYCTTPKQGINQMVEESVLPQKEAMQTAEKAQKVAAISENIPMQSEKSEAIVENTQVQDSVANITESAMETEQKPQALPEVPEVLNNEQMQAEVDQTKEEIVTAAKEKKIKYARSKSLFASILGFLTKPYGVSKPKAKVEEKTQNEEQKVVASVETETVVSEAKQKKETKKKERKRRKRKSKKNRS